MARFLVLLSDSETPLPDIEFGAAPPPDVWSYGAESSALAALLAIERWHAEAGERKLMSLTVKAG